MTPRRMRVEDMPQVIALWQQAFEDSAGFVQESVLHYAGLENTFVIENDGAIVSQLLAVPCTIEAAKGVYLYALATRQDCRGQGLMPKLMDFALETRKPSFACLIPASGTLFGYYARLGFATPIQATLLEGALDPPPNELLYALSGEEYAKTRAIWLPDAVEFDPQRFGIAFETYSAEGWCCGYAGNATAIWKAETGRLLVAELCGKSRQAMLQLLQMLGVLGGCTSFQASVPQGTQLPGATGTAKPHALAKCFGGYQLPQNAWLRFGFEDITALFESSDPVETLI